MAKRYGTNHVIQRVKCYSKEGCQHLYENFGGRSRGRSVQILAGTYGKIAENEHWLRIDFTHTARNSGNWKVDSARFVRNALRAEGKTYRYEMDTPQLVERIELKDPKEL